MIRFFRGSLIVTAIGLALAAWLGWARAHTLAGAVEMLWIVSVLAVLEVSLSFDNAVVNAAVLKDMDAVWQRRFLTWGMVIAVFGMRVVFPVAIVAIAAQIGPIEALRLSLGNPGAYERIIHGAHGAIAGFGGAFLLMVGLGFFFDSDKEVHWIGVIERALMRFSAVQAIELAVVLALLWLVSRWLPLADAHAFVLAGMLGLITYVGVNGIGTLLGGEAGAAPGVAARSGLAGFLYLNLLDATFSFDGVIGAFALTNAMAAIALGLTIGAMFVRSLTLMIVEKGTLAQYRYIEHGAFWAILALGVIMLVSARIEVPEAVTGLIGAVLIGASLWWSVRYRRHGGDQPGG